MSRAHDQRETDVLLTFDRYWATYNEGLTKITDVDNCDGVVIAEGCGHFIQKDDPSFVAKVVGSMIDKLGW